MNDQPMQVESLDPDDDEAVARWAAQLGMPVAILHEAVAAIGTLVHTARSEAGSLSTTRNRQTSYDSNRSENATRSTPGVMASAGTGPRARV